MRLRDFSALLAFAPAVFAITGCDVDGPGHDYCGPNLTPVSQQGSVASGGYASKKIVVAAAGTPFVDGTPGARTLVVDRTAGTATLTFQRNGEEVTLNFTVPPVPPQ